MIKNKPKIAYKLFKVRKDGSLGSLFINPKDRHRVGIWLRSKTHPTDGFKVRTGWHCLGKPAAPHLSNKGRQWFKIIIKDYQKLKRPKSHGSMWFLARKMKIIKQYGK